MTPILNDDNYAEIATVIDIHEADKKYNLSKLFYYHFIELAEEEEQTTVVYNGNLHLKSLEFGKNSDYVAFNLIVDGDLIVDEDLDLYGGIEGAFLYVTGSIKGRNLLAAGCMYVVVNGNLEIANAIVGCDGSDGGEVSVKGETSATYIIETDYYTMALNAKEGVLYIDDDYCCSEDEEGDSEFDVKRMQTILLPEYVNEEGYLEAWEILRAVRDGKQILKTSLNSTNN